MDTNTVKSIENMAVIVCGHIASNRSSIGLAYKVEPDCSEDSGWQFFCGLNVEESPAEAKVWSVGEILAYEPSLLPFIHLPPNTRLRRTSNDSDWSVSPYHQKEGNS